MSEESSWIFPFVQQILLQYLNQPDFEQVENDGKNLKFNNNGHVCVATIQEWVVGSDGQSSILKDAEYQIDAIFPRDQPRDFDPRHHTIQLLNFKLVVPYNSNVTQACFEVSNWHIDPQGISKNKVPKKKITKVTAIKGLLQKVQHNIRTIQAPGAGEIRPSSASRRSAPNELHNQPNNGGEQPRVSGSVNHSGGEVGGHGSILGDSESQSLSSQIPSGVLGLTSQAPGTYLHGESEWPRHSSRPSLQNSNSNATTPQEIQERIRAAMSALGPKDGHVNSTNSRATPKNVATEPISDGHPGLSRSPLREISITNRTGNATSDEEGSVVSQSRELADQISTINSSPSVRHGSQSLSKKRPREEETNESSQLDTQMCAGFESKSDYLPKKRQRIGPASELPSQIPESTNPTQQVKSAPPARPRDSVPMGNPPLRPQPAEPDPWKWLDGITDRDVVIPKDQRKLLDASTMCWIPPKAHEPLPQGHVPRWLLNVWNATAERRHRIANSQTVNPELSNSATKERIPSPTQERLASPTQESDAGSIDSVPYSEWDNDPSPEKPQRSHQILPPSSPVAPLNFIAKKSNPRLPSEHQPDVESSKNSSGSRTEYESALENNERPRSISKPSSPATTTGQAHSRDQRSGQSSHLDQAELSNRVFSQAQGTSSPSQQRNRISPKPLFNPQPTVGEDESDEDAMDTSVPFALGENMPEPTQSSQVEEGPRSSGASLPGVNNECVQVAVTPKIGSGRPQLESSSGDSTRPEASALASGQQSSQAQQGSSQSRVLNTFPFHASNETVDLTGSSTSGGPSQEEQIQVDVPLTQLPVSGMASQTQSQDVSNQSQTDIVLDSSAPAQRHQDFSLLAAQQTEIPSSHESTLSQSHMPTQESLPEEDSPHVSDDSLVIISPPRAAASAGRQSPFGSMGSETQSQRIEPIEKETLNTQSTRLLARRQDFLGAQKTYAKAQNVYRQFCRTYSSFSGDFDHFTNMCNKLRAVRQEGKLQRSPLWDDFVIMYLQDYAPYLHKQFSQDSETLGYEKYFLENFSRPSYKKRCLTAQGIEEAASQAVAGQAASKIEVEVDPPHAVSSNTHGFVMNTYFDGSLEQLANFDTNPMIPSPPAYLPVPETQQSPRVKYEGAELDLSTIMAPDTPALPTYNHVIVISPYERRQAQPQAQPQSSPQTHPQAPPQLSPETQTQARAPAPATEDVDMDEVPETDSEDAYQEDDTLHETASVELGDESFISPSRTQPQPHAEEVQNPAEAYPAASTASDDSESESEYDGSESESENWFLSLRHIKPKGPVWSDGPTEFKRWSEAYRKLDRNRRHQRGPKVLG